jgi:hypothetical protein
LAGDCSTLNAAETDHNLALMREAEERKLHSISKVLNFLEMWQGSECRRATQTESRAQNKQITPV